MKIEVEQLPYAPDALAPVISEQTIGFHHGKHLPAYVNALLGLVKDTPLADQSVEDIFLGAAPGAIYNNAGQVLNHNLYFGQFAPADKRKAAPEGALLLAINQTFGSVEKLQEAMNTAATTLFGSGWAWLASDKEGKLCIVKCPNADNPIREGLTPLLCFDVWEHAYYLDFQNRRADHVKALWSIIDWEVIEKRYTKG